MYLTLNIKKLKMEILPFLSISLILLPIVKLCFSNLSIEINVQDTGIYFMLTDTFPIDPFKKFERMLSLIGFLFSLFAFLFLCYFTLFNILEYKNKELLEFERFLSFCNTDKENLSKSIASLKKLDVLTFITLFENVLKSDHENKLLNLDKNSHSFKNLIKIIETIKEDKDNFLNEVYFLSYENDMLKIKIKGS